MIPSKVDRMRRRAMAVVARNLITAVSIEFERTFGLDSTVEVPSKACDHSFYGGCVQCEPTVEVGDRIKANGKWREVSPYTMEASDIIDVYTAAEQEANGALVQFEAADGAVEALRLSIVPSCALVDWDRTHAAGGTRFLTPETVAALGSFRPVPERDIHVGDVVRFHLNFAGGDVVEVVKASHGGGLFGGHVDSEDGRPWTRAEHQLTHVAREDAAYLFRERDGSPLPCGHSEYPCAHTPPVINEINGLPEEAVEPRDQPKAGYAANTSTARPVIKEPPTTLEEWSRQNEAPEFHPPVIKEPEEVFCQCVPEAEGEINWDCPQHGYARNPVPVIKEPEPAPGIDGPVFLGDHWCNPCTKKRDPESKCTCYPGGFTPDSFEGPKRGCPEHDPAPECAGPCTSQCGIKRCEPDVPTVPPSVLERGGDGATEVGAASMSELITAADGETYRLHANNPDLRVNIISGEHKTIDELINMGPVRRAVVIDPGPVADLLSRWSARSENERLQADRYAGFIAGARDMRIQCESEIRDLLAAALDAEEER